MAPNSDLQYYGFDRPTLPYRSNSSPTDDSPHFIPGSVNALATISGWLEKRPGFSVAVETAISAIPGTVRRLYTWRRWTGSVTNSGAFFIMASAVTGNTSTVWKYQVGTDTSFSLIWTDTTSTTPFDYQISNNFVFFGNATTRQNMRKYDGAFVVPGIPTSLWGLDPPTSAPDFELVSGALPAGLSFNATTGTISGTPINSAATSFTVTVTDNTGATAVQTLNLFIDPPGLQWNTPAGALPPAVATTAYSNTLSVQSGTGPYMFTLDSGALPAGLSLSSVGVISGTPTTASLTPASFAVKVVDAASATIIRGFSLFVGSAALSITPTSLPDATVGSAYSQAIVASGGTSPYTYAIVGGGLPPGLSIVGGVVTGTPTTAGNYSPVVRVTDSAGTPLSTEFVVPINVVATVLTVTTTSLPDAQAGQAYSQTIGVSGGTSPYSFAFTAGSITAQTGYVWGYTYTSIYGHESSMSPLSANSGLFTDQDVLLSFISSTDPQVSGINLYRTSDGGSQDPNIMRLLASVPNSANNYVDSTEDIFLGLQTGPAFFVNDPPQPLRGFVWSNGRIWGFNNQATWFTGNEEITNGIPVECMSDAKNGNFYAWASQVYGLATTDNGVDIGLSEEYWQVSGDTLDTFRKSSLLRGGGLLSPTCICVIGQTVFWIDTAKQVFSSVDGEIGESIRPDLANIDPEQTFIVYHKAKKRNWLAILDGANGRILIFDLDLSQWLTPWTVAATCLTSGQTAISEINLMAAFSTGHVRYLEVSNPVYDDDGAIYADELRSGLITMVPGRGTSARNHTEVKTPKQWEFETDTYITLDADGNVTGYQPNVPDIFLAQMDDDPTLLDLAFWSNQGSPQPLQYDAQWESRRSLTARRWVAPQSMGMGIRASFCVQWSAAPQGWKVYSLDLAWQK